MIRQDIQGPAAQVTQSGHIINCHGGDDCPWRDDLAPESQRQAEFARATGIWCPRGAREIFERLMADHGFTAPRLRTAWRANSLVWDEKSGHMVAVTPWIEAAFGYAVVALMAAYYALQGSQIMLSGVKEGWRGFVAFLSASVIYLGTAWLAGRFVIQPRRVAIRARQAMPDITSR